MARKTNRSTAPRRSRKTQKSGTSPVLIVVIALTMIAIIGGGVWLFTHNDGYSFQRSQLDKYVELTNAANVLEDGASVYVDMSDGMNSAYATPESKALLQATINKLAANKAIKFFGLANERITPMEMSHTELYNYMLNSASYNQQKAPIEATLNQIVKNRQPALLMTDFEEYKGSVIEQAAYAKKAFIDWLAMGFNITFYKWGFVEHGKQKLMFLAVFDDNANRLNSLVESAVKLTDPNIETYVLGSREFAYPTITRYPSLKQGGNYHNSKGEDVVTAIMENGGKEDYISYAQPYASAVGKPGQFAPLDVSLGAFAEYYPLGVSWTSAIKNASVMQEEGVPEEDKFTHLLSNLFIDFGAQSGFLIDGVEVRVFDMQPTMEAIYNADKVVTFETVDTLPSSEINMVLTAGMQSAPDLGAGWNEIFVDFDDKFNGTFIGERPSTNLIRANVVISNATPEIDRVTSFFSWTGNPSLANSVKEALTASSSNPQGRILFTYYLKTIAE